MGKDNPNKTEDSNTKQTKQRKTSLAPGSPAEVISLNRLIRARSWCNSCCRWSRMHQIRRGNLLTHQSDEVMRVIRSASEPRLSTLYSVEHVLSYTVTQLSYTVFLQCRITKVHSSVILHCILSESSYSTLYTYSVERYICTFAPFYTVEIQCRTVGVRSVLILHCISTV